MSWLRKLSCLGGQQKFTNNSYSPNFAETVKVNNCKIPLMQNRMHSNKTMSAAFCIAGPVIYTLLVVSDKFISVSVFNYQDVNTEK